MEQCRDAIRHTCHICSKVIKNMHIILLSVSQIYRLICQTQHRLCGCFIVELILAVTLCKINDLRRPPSPMSLWGPRIKRMDCLLKMRENCIALLSEWPQSHWSP